MNDKRKRKDFHLSSRRMERFAWEYDDWQKPAYSNSPDLYEDFIRMRHYFNSLLNDYLSLYDSWIITQQKFEYLMEILEEDIKIIISKAMTDIEAKLDEAYRLIQEMRRLTEEVRKLTEENRSLTSENRLLTSENRLLTSENRLLTSENREINEKVKDALEQIIKIKEQIDIIFQDIENKYDEIKVIYADIKNIKIDIDLIFDQIKDIQIDINNKYEEIKLIYEDIKRMYADIILLLGQSVTEIFIDENIPQQEWCHIVNEHTYFNNYVILNGDVFMWDSISGITLYTKKASGEIKYEQMLEEYKNIENSTPVTGNESNYEYFVGRKYNQTTSKYDLIIRDFIDGKLGFITIEQDDDNILFDGNSPFGASNTLNSLLILNGKKIYQINIDKINKKITKDSEFKEIDASELVKFDGANVQIYSGSCKRMFYILKDYLFLHYDNKISILKIVKTKGDNGEVIQSEKYITTLNSVEENSNWQIANSNTLFTYNKTSIKPLSFVQMLTADLKEIRPTDKQLKIIQNSNKVFPAMYGNTNDYSKTKYDIINDEVTVYVDESSTNYNGNGKTEETAFAYIEQAIELAQRYPTSLKVIVSNKTLNGLYTIFSDLTNIIFDFKTVEKNISGIIINNSLNITFRNLFVDTFRPNPFVNYEYLPTKEVSKYSNKVFNAGIIIHNSREIKIIKGIWNGDEVTGDKINFILSCDNSSVYLQENTTGKLMNHYIYRAENSTIYDDGFNLSGETFTNENYNIYGIGETLAPVYGYPIGGPYQITLGNSAVIEDENYYYAMQTMPIKLSIFGAMGYITDNKSLNFGNEDFRACEYFYNTFDGKIDNAFYAVAGNVKYSYDTHTLEILGERIKKLNDAGDEQNAKAKIMGIIGGLSY